MNSVAVAARIRRYAQSEAFWLLVVCVIALSVTVVRHTASPVSGAADEPEAMLFVGDIMLARHVETLMDAHGAYYPFAGVRELFDAHAVVVGNFEGSIPERHVHTPNRTMRFSVDARAATVLVRVGITDLSLANNHALDYGRAGFAHTQTVLSGVGIAHAGDPEKISPGVVQYRDLGEVTVAIVPLNTVGGAPAHAALAETLEVAEAASDLQVVYVHWGTEYVPEAGAAEQQLAHTLVDLGADVVVGHHPHVVQQIEEYRGALIFYSLGNFVFDQYWNDAVQEGLALSLSVVGSDVHYELIPVSSREERSVPMPMERVARTQFLDALAKRSDPAIADAVRAGTLVAFVPSLASSARRYMMGL